MGILRINYGLEEITVALGDDPLHSTTILGGNANSKEEISVRRKLRE